MKEISSVIQMVLAKVILVKVQRPSALEMVLEI